MSSQVLGRNHPLIITHSYDRLEVYRVVVVVVPEEDVSGCLVVLTKTKFWLVGAISGSVTSTQNLFLHRRTKRTRIQMRMIFKKLLRHDRLMICRRKMVFGRYKVNGRPQQVLGSDGVLFLQKRDEGPVIL